MQNELRPEAPGKPRATVPSLIVASLFWLVILCGAVTIFAAAAILVGAANPFRYVGF